VSVGTVIVGVKVGEDLTNEGSRVSFVEVEPCDGVFVKISLVGVSVGELLETIVGGEVGEIVTDEG